MDESKPGDSDQAAQDAPKPDSTPTPEAHIDTPEGAEASSTESNKPLADNTAQELPDQALAEPKTPTSEDIPENSQFATPETLAQQDTSEDIVWTASEFIAHSKSASWYAMLAIVALIVAGLVFLVTKDKISTGVVIIAALALGFYAGRKPRELRYVLGRNGLDIGQKHFDYSIFRSFAVMDEGHFSSIAFLPLKRFGQLTTIYYDPGDEEKIVGLLNKRLPLEPRQHDVVDRLMKRIRF